MYFLQNVFILRAYVCFNLYFWPYKATMQEICRHIVTVNIDQKTYSKPRLLIVLKLQMIIINLTNFLVFSHKALHIWLIFVINNIPTFVSSWSVITDFPSHLQGTSISSGFSVVPLSIKARNSHPSAQRLFKGLVQRMILPSFFPKYEHAINRAFWQRFSWLIWPVFTQQNCNRSALSLLSISFHQTVKLFP